MPISVRSEVPIEPFAVQSPIDGDVEVMDVMRLAGRRIGRERIAKRKNGHEPTGQPKATVPGAIGAVYGHQQAHERHQIPRWQIIDGPENADVKHSKNNHDLRHFPKNSAENVQVAARSVVQRVQPSVEGGALVQHCVGDEKPKIVNSHHGPEEQVRRKRVERDDGTGREAFAIESNPKEHGNVRQRNTPEALGPVGVLSIRN